jgi:hypothetical protein
VFQVIIGLFEKKRLPDLDKFSLPGINTLTRYNDDCFDFETR